MEPPPNTAPWDTIIGDVLIHDLRHTFASHAVMQGVNLPMIPKLPGHRQIAMTLRHTHDTDAVAAAGRVGGSIDRLLAGEEPDEEQ